MRTCYRCDKPAPYRISWLAYPDPPYAHDPACQTHAHQAAEWAVITRSTAAQPWHPPRKR